VQLGILHSNCASSVDRTDHFCIWIPHPVFCRTVGWRGGGCNPHRHSLKFASVFPVRAWYYQHSVSGTSVPSRSIGNEQTCCRRLGYEDTYDCTWVPGFRRNALPLSSESFYPKSERRRPLYQATRWHNRQDHSAKIQSLFLFQCEYFFWLCLGSPYLCLCSFSFISNESGTGAFLDWHKRKGHLRIGHEGPERD